MTDTKDDLGHAKSNAAGWLASIEEMNTAYAQAQTTDNENDREEAERTIHESVLSILVREGWHQPGLPSEDGPDEYEILLTTGGPALRIWGKLDQHCQPSSAELQMQDWGTPWTRYLACEATIIDFARVFYFGE